MTTRRAVLYGRQGPNDRKALLYGRVSKLAAGTTEGKSVDQQLAELRAIAARDQVDVVGEHRDDGISASGYARGGKGRDGWRGVMAAIADGECSELWVWEISRATRDRPVWAKLVTACIAQDVKITVAGRVHDPSDPDDGFMLDLTAALAVRESAVTSKRIQRDVRAAAAAGRPHGRIPYGYLREYDPLTRALVRQYPDPDTGAVVAEIIRRVADGDPGYAIAADLDRRGVPSPHQVRAARLGRSVDDPYPWTLEQVHRIARNPTYAALRTHDLTGTHKANRPTVVGPGQWEPIVSRELHDRAVLVLGNPSRRTNHETAVRHLLSGIALCGVCGSVCRVIKNRGYPSYSCWGKPAKRGTSCVTRSQLPVDVRVTEAILTRLEQPDAAGLFAPEGSDDEATEARRELARLEARLDEFRASADSPDGISAASLARAERSLEPLIAAARARTVPGGVPPLVRQALAAPDVRVWWYGEDGKPETALPLADRRAVVQAMVQVTILKSPYRNGTRGFDPDLISIRWV